MRREKPQDQRAGPALPLCVLMLLAVIPLRGQSVPQFMSAPSTGSLSRNLAAWLKINEGVTGSPTVLDYSGHNNNGTWAGSAAGTVGHYSVGPGGQYVGVFDGTSNYITVANSASLQASSAVTVCAQVYSTTGNGSGAPASVQGLFEKRNTGSYEYGLQMGKNSLTMIYPANTHGWNATNSTGNIAVATWQTICEIQSSAGGYVYANGTPFAATESSVAPGSNTFPLNIGVAYAGSSFFSGKLANLMIWTRALSRAEINMLSVGSSFSIGMPANGLEQTPAMGWNPWYLYTTTATETQIKANCAAMHTNGMQALGYTYCGVDEGWAQARNSSGQLAVYIPNIPNGMAALGAYIHGLGQKFTLYDGPYGCGVQPGAYGYELNDALLFASWGADYVKYDNCNGGVVGILAQQTYQKMNNALRATGRPMIFLASNPYSASISQWGSLIGASESWNAPDEGTPAFSTFMTILDGIYGTEVYAGPGDFNLPTYVGAGNGTMSDTEGQSQFSLLCLLASPLFASANLSSGLSANSLATLTNLDAINVDQDAAGIQGKRVQRTACGGANCEVYLKQLSGANRWALIFLNRDASAETISTTWSTLNGVVPAFANMAYTTCSNVWGNWPSSCSGNHCSTALGTLTSGFTATNVPSHGVVMLTLAP